MVIEKLCDIESIPWTQNYHYYFSNRDKFSKLYQSVYRVSRGEQSVLRTLTAFDSNPTTDSNATSDSRIVELTKQILSGYAGLGIHGVKADDFVKLRPADHELTPALEIMADVRAYFQGALADPTHDL